MSRPPLDEEDDDATDDEYADDSDLPTLAAGTRDDAGLAAAAAAATATKRSGGDRDDVASLAHDLKNPLTIIMLEATQIEQRLGGRTTPAILRGLERIAQNASYIDRLVSDMLDLASEEAGRLEL